MKNPKTKKTIQQLAKLSRPQVGIAYPRTRLFKRLDESAAITWITASPGAGKTTLVSSYLETRKLKTLWYQVDKRDEDAPTLFHYLGLAGKQNWPRSNMSFPVLGPEYNQGLEVFALNYFEQLFSLFKKAGILVFDNYQELDTDSVVHQLLARSFEQLPPHIKVIIISRSTVHNQYLRLKLNGQLTELSATELVLDQEEAQGILKQRELKSLVSTNANRILEQTHGLAAGFILALEGLKQNRPITGNLDNFISADVFNYFISEVFSQLESTTQEQLLFCSLMPRITSPQLSEISDLPINNLLEDLAQRNYFTVSHPGKPTVYEFHPLFREFLIDQTEKNWNHQKIQQVKIKSAELLAASSQIEDAISLYLEAQQWLNAVKLLEEHSQTYINEGRHRLLEQWLSLCVKRSPEQHPWINYWLARCQVLQNPYQSIENFTR